MVKKYVENNCNIHGSVTVQKWHILGFIILFPLIFSSHAVAEPPENSCLSYAYTESVDHNFLLESNKSVFGSNMTIIHNCDYIEVYVNGNFTAYTSQKSLNFPLQLGFNDINILAENYSKNISNVYVFPDRLSWQFEFQEWKNSDNDYSLNELILRSTATAEKNWASILSVTLVFTLVTMVYWNLINAYVDRNFCEEVK